MNHDGWLSERGDHLSKLALYARQADLSFKPYSCEWLVWVRIADEIDHDRLSKALCGHVSAIGEPRCAVPQVALKMKKEVLFEECIEPLELILNDPIQNENARERLEAAKDKTLAFLRRNGI